MPVRVDVALCLQVFPQFLGLLDAERRAGAILVSHRHGRKLVRLDDAEADAGVVLDLLLQVLGELLVALRRDDGERVDLEAAQALAFLIDAEAQTPTDGLPPLALGLNVAQRADLEDVGVVPALLAGRSGRR